MKLGGRATRKLGRRGLLTGPKIRLKRCIWRRRGRLEDLFIAQIWDETFPTELFATQRISAGVEVRKVMEASIDVVQTHRKGAGTLLNSEGKVSDECLAELSSVGYWQLLVDVEYGGAGSKFAPFSRFLTEMATIDATVAGMASVHGCIGAVNHCGHLGRVNKNWHSCRLWQVVKDCLHLR